ncbi:MAG TPA: 16S rRNA (cytidine(1402)-2'-O)-methyltransferase [Chroococcidiopsis sp.]
MQIKPGTLYVVATPIGNLEDMTFRAVQVLQGVDWIAAEDTRHTGKLLQHFEVTTPQLSYHDHNRHSRLPELIERLQQGKAIALVSDAGMPGISDPGYELVCACVEAGVEIVPIPGASAVVTALSAAGLPTDRFAFEGFLPAKGQERRDRLESLQNEARTLVFYEAPHRVLQTLTDFAATFGGDRPIVLARELTKMHEQFWRGTVEEAIAHYSSYTPQGEFTLLVAGYEAQQPLLSESALIAELKDLLQQGLSRSQASRQLAQRTALPRREIYQIALSIADEGGSGSTGSPTGVKGEG